MPISPHTPTDQPHTAPPVSAPLEVIVSSLDRLGDPGHQLAHGRFLQLRRACEFAGEQATITARMGGVDTVWVVIVAHDTATGEHREVLAVRGRPAIVTESALTLCKDPTTPVRVVT